MMYEFNATVCSNIKEVMYKLSERKTIFPKEFDVDITVG